MNEGCKKINSIVFVEVVFTMLSVIVSLTALFFAYKLWSFDFHIPLMWGTEGDGGMANIKNTIQGNLYEYPRLAAPFGTAYYANDYIFQFFILRGIGLFTTDVALASNIFWVITYILTAVTSYLFLRRVRCSYFVSIFGATVYNFLPHHYFRYDHIWLMGCFFIPLACWIAADILEVSYPEEWKWWGTKQILAFQIVTSVLIGMNGLYYTFFSGMLITFCGIIMAIENKDFKKLIKPLVLSLFIVIISAFCIMGMSYIFDGGTLFAKMQGTRRLHNVIRYGLRIFTLFFPIPGHRIRVFSDFTAKYYTDLEVTDEYAFEPMGFFMAFGFLLSIVVVFFKGRIKNLQERIWRISQINLFLTLLSVTGGASVFIGIFITYAVRCYCRMEVFIALLSISFICIMLDQLFEKINLRRTAKIVVCLLLSTVAVLDQTSDSFANYRLFDTYNNRYTRSMDEVNSLYKTEDEFVKKIEDSIGVNKLVWVYTSNNNGHSGKYIFNSLRGMNVSKTIKWNQGFCDENYGTMVASIEKKSIEQMLGAVAILGFDGFVVDRYGLKNSSFTQLKNYLDKISVTEPIVNEYGNLMFWDISDYCDKLRHLYTEKETEEIRNLLHYYSGIVLNDIQHEAGVDTIEYNRFEILGKSLQFLITGISKEDIMVNGFVDAPSGRIYDPPEMIEGNGYVVLSYSFDGDIRQSRLQILKNNGKFDDVRFARITTEDGENVNTEIIDRVLKLEEFYKNVSKVYTYQVSNLKVICNELNTEMSEWTSSITIDPKALFHGPYLDLEKGSYEAHIYGENLTDTECTLRFYMDSVGGGTEGEARNQNITIDDDEITIRFELDKYTDDVEFFLKNYNHNIKINSATYKEEKDKVDTEIDMSLWTFADQYVYPETYYVLEQGDELLLSSIGLLPGKYSVYIDGDGLQGTTVDCDDFIDCDELISDEWLYLDLKNKEYIDGTEIKIRNDYNNIVIKGIEIRQE